MAAPERAQALESVGRYQLIERLAVGGMAEIFLAMERGGSHALDRLVVIKRILPHLAEEKQFLEMFLREARMAARIQHPNVVQIYELGEAGGFPFIAMEYVPGSSVKHLLSAARKAEVTLPIGTVVHMISQACAGAHAAHELEGSDGRPVGLVHRDITPHNLMVDDHAHVKLLDFGIAKAAEGMDTTKTGLLKGKIAYMSPEQCRQEPLDRRSDVFGLGICAWELLVGEKPFRGKSELGTMQAIVTGRMPHLREARPEVPEPIAAAVHRALALDRDARWESADAMRRGLREAAQVSGVDIDEDRAGLLVRTLLGEQHEERRLAVEEAKDRTLVSLNKMPAGGGSVPSMEAREGTPSRGSRTTGTATAGPDTRVAAAGVVASLGALAGVGGVVFAGLALILAIGLAVGSGSFAEVAAVEEEPPAPSPPVLEGDPIRVALAPVLSDEELKAEHKPLTAYLERTLLRPVEFYVAAEYSVAAMEVIDGSADFAFLPQGTTSRFVPDHPDLQLLAVKEVDGSDGTDGYIIVRRDAGISGVEQLRGRTFCYADTNSNTGYRLPRRYMKQRGIDPETDIRGRISGDHATVLVHVLERKCDAGGTHSGNFQTADSSGLPIAQLRILATTGTVPHDVFVASRHTDPELVVAFKDALLAFDPATHVGEDRMGDRERITGFNPPPPDYVRDVSREAP